MITTVSNSLLVMRGHGMGVFGVTGVEGEGVIGWGGGGWGDGRLQRQGVLKVRLKCEIGQHN